MVEVLEVNNCFLFKLLLFLGLRELLKSRNIWTPEGRELSVEVILGNIQRQVGENTAIMPIQYHPAYSSQLTSWAGRNGGAA